MTDPDATIVRPPRAPQRTQTLRREDDPDATVIVPIMRNGSTATLPMPPPPPPLPPALVARAPALALQPGFQLHEYRIDSVLGQGGFGITYLATDVHLNSAVAIKEYLPEEIAFRAGDRSVSPNASRHRDRYRDGLENFLTEARTLASFRHPSLVRVARFFEAHQTAYMVLEYEKGSPFKTWWPQHKHLGEAGLIELLLPLLDGLEAVHAAGFLHRDIKPDNIQVRVDGSLVLLDFGSAGQTVAVAEQGAVVLTPGYAPIEQYGMGQQGPWTDLYALGATLYWAVTGKKPPDAEMRAVNPSAMQPAVAAGKGQFGEAFLKAIDWALHTDPAQRPRNVAELRRALCADHLASLDLQEALQQGDHAHGLGRLKQLHQRWHPRDWPLAVKLALAMLATALLPMLLTGAYNLQGSQEAVSAAELRYVQQMAHSTASRVAQFVGDSRNLARALATDALLPSFLAAPDATPETTREAMNDKLTRLSRANPDLQLIMLMDAQGAALSSSDAALIGRNFRFRQYFQEAMAGRPFVTGIIVGAGAGASGMFFAEPVRAADGSIAGALVMRVLGSSVAAILDEVQNDSQLTPFLIDGDGVLIHHPREDRLYSSLVPLTTSALAAIRADQRFRRDQIKSLGETELATAMRGATRTGHVSYHSASNRRDEIAGFAPVVGHDWVVGVSEPRATFEAPLSRLMEHLLWSLLLVGLLFAGLGLRFARGVVRPVRRLTDAANALKAGDYEAARVDVSGRDEVGQLGRTFNVMIDVLRQRDRERQR